MTHRIETRAHFVDPSATTLVLSARFAAIASAPGVYGNVSAGTVAIRDEAGASVLTATATTTGTEPTLSVSMPAGIVAGKIYRATWQVTISTALRPMFVPLYALGFDGRDCPVTTNDLLAAHPTLDAVPDTDANWERVIQVAWDRVLSRVVRSEVLRTGLWSVHQLREVTRCAALAGVFRQGATYTAGPALELADHYERRLDDEWRALRLDLDTDLDGDVDAASQPLTTPSFPGVRPATR